MVLKIGDTVALGDVSDGMMVRIEADFCVRIRGRGLFAARLHAAGGRRGIESDEAARLLAR